MAQTTRFFSARRALRGGGSCVALALLFGSADGATAQQTSDATAAAEQPRIERARVVGALGHRNVREIRQAYRDAGRLDWMRRDDKIVFDRPNADGYHDIYLADAAGGVDRCITCANYVFHKKNVLDPAWHPGGDHIVVQVQMEAKRLKQGILEMATPLRGVHSELWVVTSNGKLAWRLTTLQERGAAVLGATFSNEANRLLWRERLSTKDVRPFGSWGTRIGGWSIRRGTPRIGKVELIAPVGHQGLDLAQEFTPDDRGVLIARKPAGEGVGWGGLDLMLIDIETGAPQSLTATPGVRDDIGRFSPNSRYIAWASEQGIKPLPSEERRLPWRGDVWIMRADGSSQERLSFWNDPDSDHSLGQAMIIDMAWSPDGDRLLVSVVEAGPEVQQAIWEIALEAPFE